MIFILGLKLTPITEEAFRFLIFGCRNGRSYKHVHYGHQQDDQQNYLGLSEQRTIQIKVQVKTSQQKAEPSFLTFASHSIPATEIPRSSTTVMHPMILMSFVSSTISVACSCGQTGS